jgi:hypothetical protein
VLPVLDGDVIGVPTPVEVCDNRLRGPIAIGINHIAAVTGDQQLGIQARIIRPGFGVWTDPDLALWDVVAHGTRLPASESASKARN